MCKGQGITVDMKKAVPATSTKTGSGSEKTGTPEYVDSLLPPGERWRERERWANGSAGLMRRRRRKRRRRRIRILARSRLGARSELLLLLLLSWAPCLSKSPLKTSSRFRGSQGIRHSSMFALHLRLDQYLYHLISGLYCN